MTTNEAKFRKIISDIADKDFRSCVEDTARVNAQDTIKEYGSDAFWQVAIDTAEMVIDDPASFGC